MGAVDLGSPIAINLQHGDWWQRCVHFLLIAFIASVCLWPARAAARSPQTASPTLRSADAVRVERAPKLDGTLDDPLWKQAKPIEQFFQKEPAEGQVPTERTEIRILYTQHEVYFGVYCYDSQPSQIVAGELRRDVSQDLDDHFEILIDSRHDRRNAYVFEFNPLGTQLDGLISEEANQQNSLNGADFDSGWDGIWTSEARITKDGWSATIAVPFSTLNFTKSKNVVWGVNFKRFIRRKNEEDLWAAWRRTWGITKVSEAGELHGITEIGSGRLFIVKPYGLLGAEQMTGHDWHALDTGGVDIKYGLRSNLVLNITANTDFADTEADQQFFNLSPFKISIPEKRPFFLENQGIFDFSTGGTDRLFFSRQIGIDPNTGLEVPINAGAKVTGAVGNFQLGLMDVETRSTGTSPSANYAVARLTHPLFGSSYIGAMYIDKRSGGNPLDPYNQSAGLDMRLVLPKNVSLYFWGAGTRSLGLTKNATDVGVSWTYLTNLLQLTGGVDKIAPNYNPEVGYVPQVNAKEVLVDPLLTPRPKLRGVRQLQFECFFWRQTNTLDRLQIEQRGGRGGVYFNNGSYFTVIPDFLNVQRLNTPFNIYKNISIPTGIYRYDTHHFEAGSPQDRPLTLMGYYEFGTYYGGKIDTAFVMGTYRPGPRWSFSTGETWNQIHLPQGNFTVDVASLQTNYSFSRFLTFTSLMQVNTSNNQAVSANLRLRYNYRPDSDFYVIYNVGTQFESLNGSNQQQIRDARFAIKFTYSFQPRFGHTDGIAAITPDSPTSRMGRVYLGNAANSVLQ